MAGDNLAALSRSAGAIGGFAEGFDKARQAQLQRESNAAMLGMKMGVQRDANSDKRAKWEAYDQIMRENQDSKYVDGQELIDYGRGLGIDASKLPFKPGQQYSAEDGKQWIGSVARLQGIGTQEAGRNNRNKAGLDLKAAQAKGMDLPKFMTTADAQARAAAGIPKGVQPGDPSLPQETQDLYSHYYKTSLDGMISNWQTTTGRQAGVAAGAPGTHQSSWGGFGTPKDTQGSQVVPVQPTAGPVPGPAAQPLQTQVPSKRLRAPAAPGMQPTPAPTAGSALDLF